MHPILLRRTALHEFNSFSHSRASLQLSHKLHRAGFIPPAQTHNHNLRRHNTMSKEQIEELQKYSACDIADALLKLHVPGAGFLPNICKSFRILIQALIRKVPFESTSPIKLIGRASTFLFVAHSTPSFPTSGSGNPLGLLKDAISRVSPNIEQGKPYSDLAEPETIAILSQPRGQTCAVMGGIMAIRMAKLGVRAVLVDGRVRDLTALSGCGIPIWSRGTSVIGAGAETRPWATNVPISIGNTVVHPGDVIMMDSTERGAVCIPRDALSKVLEMLPKLVAADEKVVEDVEAGGTVEEAFKKHRG